MGKSDLTIARDTGEIEIGADLGRGMVSVSVRAPLGIEKATAEIAFVDFMEIAAKFILASCESNRAAQAALAAKMMKGGAASA